MITTKDDAELLAIRVLGFIGEEADRLGRFLAVTGLEVERLRETAQLPLFLPAVLDYAAADQGILNALDAKAGISPGAVEAARSKLSPQAEQPAVEKERLTSTMPPRRSLFR